MNESLNEIIASVKGHVEMIKSEGVDVLDLPIIALPEMDEMETYVAPKVAPAKRNKDLTLKKLSPKQKVAELIKLREEVIPCVKCNELSSLRTNIVFGTGNANARLCFVGEAPGKDEDEQGKPFVGRAGKLLTKIIESIGFTREQVFICNTLKCRPPKNRNPMPEELNNCEPFLLRQLEIIQPEVICALGTFAAQRLLQTDVPISQLRGKFHDYHGLKLLPTFHPAYLLRNPSAKTMVWEDMKMIKKEIIASMK